MAKAAKPAGAGKGKDTKTTNPKKPGVKNTGADKSGTPGGDAGTNSEDPGAGDKSGAPGTDPGTGDKSGAAGTDPGTSSNDHDKKKNPPKPSKEDKLEEKMKPYIKPYPGEKEFHVTSDGQVFLSKDKVLAIEHQRQLDKENSIQTYSVEA